MVDGRVEELVLSSCLILGAIPAEVWRLSALRKLDLGKNRLDERAGGDRAAHIAEMLDLHDNKLTSVPAEVGHVTSLQGLILDVNQLTSVPAVIWQLTSLMKLSLRDNQLTSVSAEIGQLTSLMKLSLTTS